MYTLYQPLRPVRPVSLQVSISTGKRSIEIEDAREKSNIFSSLHVLLQYFIYIYIYKVVSQIYVITSIIHICIYRYVVIRFRPPAPHPSISDFFSYTPALFGTVPSFRSIYLFKTLNSFRNLFFLAAGLPPSSLASPAQKLKSLRDRMMVTQIILTHLHQK